MLLSRDHAMSHPPLLKTEKVDVPEFGDGTQVALRALTAKQRWEFGKLAAASGDDDKSENREPTSYLITVSAIDDGGKLLFTPQDVDAIAEWPGDVVDRLGTRIMEMSGLSRGDSDAEKKSSNSGKTENDSSVSDSPATSDVPATN